jgi:predicted RNase H-like nuclease (RuvC/YqgF family)
LVSELTYENVALREDLQRARLTIERLEGEVETLYRAAQAATKRNLELTKRLQAIADEADADIELAAARRAELEALEL